MKKEESLILKLRSIYPSLSKKKKAVADTIFISSNDTIYNSITEFAEKCSVSETTIVRLCRKIGMSGYQEFKLRLAVDSSFNAAAIRETSRTAPIDSMEQIIERVATTSIDAINNTCSMINSQQLEEAINIIMNANAINVYGVGASGYTAFDVVYKFKRLGFQVNAYSDSHMQSMSASLLTPQDAVIGITFSGSTKDTVDSVALAKKSGAKVICVTNHMKSPITRYSDVTLLTSVRETPLESGALSSKIAQLFILDLLYTGVFVKMKELAEENLSKTAEAVLGKLY